MRASLDFITKLEASLLNFVMIDFTVLSSIFLYSEKCSPKEYQRYEDSYRWGNKGGTIFDHIRKSDKTNTSKSNPNDSSLGG